MFLGHFSSEMRDRSGVTTEIEASHEKTKPAAMKRDEKQVNDLIDHIRNKMTNPFDVALHSATLIHISTGMHASKDVQDSLLISIDEGTKMAKSFVEGSLSNGQSRSFNNPIRRSKLKSFEDMTRKTKLKCRSGNIVNVHINPELVFRRALALANCRNDVTVDKVLSYPIGPIPTAIFHDDGTMRKTCKVDLAHQLEQDVLVSPALPIFDISKTTYIRDGMALLQSVDTNKDRNCGELAMYFVRHQVASFQFASMVADIFDSYMTSKIQSKCGTRTSVQVFLHCKSFSGHRRKNHSRLEKNSLKRFLGDYTVRYLSENSCLKEGQKLYLARSFQNP